MDDAVNIVLTTSVMLGGVVGLARTITTNQRRVQLLRNVGICERCKGTSLQQCQLCYGVGSIARPGYINVADPALRRKCRRCAGFGRLPCGLCGASSQLPPQPAAYTQPAVEGRKALPPPRRPPPAAATPQPIIPAAAPCAPRRDLARAEQYLQLDVDLGHPPTHTEPPPPPPRVE